MGGKRYSDEFRREAIALAKSSDRSRREIAESLGVAEQTLYAWLKDEREMQERRDDPSRLADEELEELKRLRKQVVDLKMDNEILRKAAAYFAKETK